MSEEENGDGRTGKEQMLEASREEIRKKIPENTHGLNRLYRSVVFVLDQYIYEPIATSLRFVYLAIIFVPVLAAVPATWFGRRRKDFDNERSGALWWYGFLVASMERAGPAFIKLGQWAASRTDIFPVEMCRIMSELHSNAPAHSLKHTQQTIMQAFGNRPFDEIFEEFQEKPLGVGAIAQVYKARLKPGLAMPDMDTEESPNLRQLVSAVKGDSQAFRRMASGVSQHGPEQVCDGIRLPPRS